MGTLSWSTEADWDGAVSEDGVAHESVTNTDHSDAGSVLRGYSYANPYLSASLVGYWPLQEDTGSTAYDFGGTNDGTLYDGVTQGVTSILETTGYSFDNSANRVEISNQSAYTNGGTGDLTAMAWVRPHNISTDQSNDRNTFFIIRRSGTDPRVGWSLAFLDHSSIDWLMEDSGNNQLRSTYNASSSFDLTAWHLVAGVRNGTSSYLYFDGNQVASDSNSSFSDCSTGEPLHIGQTSPTDGNYPDGFNGDVSHAGIWNTALSGSEIQEYYDVVGTSGSLTTDWRSP